MSHGTSETVECPLCGTSFDPSSAGGWCPNSDCGEWQYEPDETSDDTANTGVDEPSDEQTDASGSSESVTADVTDAADDVDAAGAASGDATAPDDDATVADESTEDAELACPGCGVSIEADDNFCRECGADVAHLEPGSTELDACPQCGEDVEAADSFCRSCGENLDAYRPGATGGTPGNEGGNVGQAPATNTPSSSSHPGGPAGDPPGDGSQAGGAPSAGTQAGGAPAGATRGGSAQADGVPAGADGSAADLALVVRNRKIAVGPGDTVGREIRSIIAETGGDEDDAVRVHREHIRFERDGDRYHVVDLGQNPTVVNGESLEEGDRVPIGPGDRIELSGVAKIGVEEA